MNTYPGARVYLAGADNLDLVAMVVKATRDAWPYLGAPIARKIAPREVHAFARDSITYEKETGDQLIRMPWRTLSDGKGDCKSLAALTASLCRASGCRTTLRFVRYAGSDHFAHVYTVADGYVVDPELPFGKEVKYAAAFDVPI